MSSAEFSTMIETATAAGLIIEAYPKQYLINATDSDVTIQSYYASTGTAVFRDGNNKYRSKKKAIRNFSFDRFIELCKGDGDNDILEFFEED